eukprot:499146-Amphidinium_carterae.1
MLGLHTYTCTTVAKKVGKAWKDQLHYLIGCAMNAVLLAHVLSVVFARVFSFPLVSMARLWERWEHFEAEFQQRHQ